MHDITIPQVSLHHNRPVTTSMNVACVFEKNHKDVLRSIAELDCSEEFAGRNFAPGSYRDANNQQRPLHEMTRDGFVYLAFSFTGKKYAPFKEAYIEAFNAMESELRQAPAHVAALKQHLAKELLRQRPDWKRIIRYKGYGLWHREIAKLMDMSVCSVRLEVRKLEACGLLEPPARLAAMRQGALRLHQEASHV